MIREDPTGQTKHNKKHNTNTNDRNRQTSIDTIIHIILILTIIIVILRLNQQLCNIMLRMSDPLNGSIDPGLPSSEMSKADICVYHENNNWHAAYMCNLFCREERCV